MEEIRIDILNRVKAGEISVEEGARLLSALEEPQAVEEPQPVAASPDRAAEMPVVQQASTADIASDEIQSLRRWWLIPLWVGFGFVVFAAGMMFWAMSSARMFWFYCAWLPMLLGALTLIVAVWSKFARWLHVRVREDRPGHRTNIRFSFPIPTRLAGWALRFAKPYIPRMKEQDWVETVIPILNTIGETREPMVVEVNEEEGQKVQVYIL